MKHLISRQREGSARGALGRALAGGRLPRSTMLEIFLLISYWKRHACAHSLEASCKAARCRWQLFGWQQCVHYMLCAPRPIVGGAGCGGWSSLNPCGGGSTRRPRQALQCRSQRRPSGLRGPCVCVSLFLPTSVGPPLAGRECVDIVCLAGSLVYLYTAARLTLHYLRLA